MQEEVGEEEPSRDQDDSEEHKENDVERVKKEPSHTPTSRVVLGPKTPNVQIDVSRSVFTVVSPSDIMPLPKTTTRKVVRGRKREKARNITSSPSLNELKTAQALKDIDQLKKSNKFEQKHASNTNAETPKRKRGRPK